MRTCNWKSEETSLLHPIASSVPFVEDVRERESVALTGCLPCGYMVTGGMLAVGLMANALTLRTPASPLHHGTEPQIELGNQALFFPSRRRLSVHPTRGSSKKRYPYSHLDWIPPKNSLTSHSVTVRLSVRQIRREGAARPAVPMSCPSANVPNKLQKQTRISIRVLQPCNSTSKLQGFFAKV